MSFCPTAFSALEHDTARRLESLDSVRLDRLDRLHLAHDRSDGHSGAPFGAPRAPFTPSPLRHAEHADRAPEPNGNADGMLAHVADATVPAPARDPAREALDRTCLTVKRIAEDIRMPRATLEAYRLGTRRMPPAARVRLGTYLAAHAAMLGELATALIAAEQQRGD